jgi:ribonuclease D
MYITTEADLTALCERLAACDMLAIDTEFVRERTYFHRLGLIQVAGGEECAAIDPIQVSNLDPFLDLIRNPKILKVFHAGKQDLEILYRLCGEAIRPVFDTQIAASLIGWGSQISFAKIVHKAIGKKIHKGETYTDWCRRPLTQNQIAYALDDARYLVPVYEKLIRLLNKMDRLEWLQGEFKMMENPENYQPPDPRKQFLRIKNIRNLKPRSLGVLRELTAWREGEAMRRDCLAKSVIRDEPLLEIARLLPRDIESLESIRGMNRREVQKKGNEILAAIQHGLDLPEDELPELPDFDGYSTSRGVEELLAAYVQIRSEELKIEPSILAQRKHIHDFVKCHERDNNLEDHILLKGWRKDCIGSLLLSILEGKKGLTIDRDGKVNLISIHRDESD